MARIEINWSKLIPLKEEDIKKIGAVSGVYRLSKKADDGKFYVFFVGSAESIGDALLDHISATESNTRLKQYLSNGGEFVFRYAVVQEKSVQGAIEKQMYRQYIPEYNPKEPESSLDIEANLN